MTRTYGKLARDGLQWVISDLEPHVAIKLKAIFAKVPKHSSGPFKLAGDAQTAADIAWFISRYPLSASEADLALLEADRVHFEAVQAEVGRIMLPDWTAPDYAGLREGQEVRPHQARARELIQRFGGLLVADEMGEGKTYTGAACCLIPGALPATVVCPPHLKAQWAEKIEAFTTLTTHVVKGMTPYALPPVDVRIFGYTNVAGWIDYLPIMGTGLCIFDETHELRRGVEHQGQVVKKGKAAMAVAETSRMRLGLTGTPIFNYGDEIWNVLSFIRPEVLGAWGDFHREWIESGREVKDPDALGSFLYEQHAMIRKAGQGPRPNVIIEQIDHDRRKLASVEDVARALANKAATGLFTERGQAVRELDMMLRYETGVAKALFVARYVRILLEAGEPVMLFGWHREVYDIWLRELADFQPAMFTGTESQRQKEEAKRRFLDGETSLFIMSLRSGAGVDGLQARCKVGVFGELDWSPQMHAQCVGRYNREGQACWPDPVTAIYLVADDGSDPPIMEVLGLKSSQAHYIVNPGEEMAVVERDERPLQALVDRYLSRREVAA